MYCFRENFKIISELRYTHSFNKIKYSWSLNSVADPGKSGDIKQRVQEGA